MAEQTLSIFIFLLKTECHCLNFSWKHHSFTKKSKTWNPSLYIRGKKVMTGGACYHNICICRCIVMQTEIDCAELISIGSWLAHTVTWICISVKHYLIDRTEDHLFSLLLSLKDHHWTQGPVDQPPQAATLPAFSKMLPQPNFNSPEDVVPYLIRHWDLLTMTEVTRACAWGLDPGFIQHDAIVHFIRSLPRFPEEQLPTMQDCHICYSPYPEHPTCEIPGVRMRCGHIVAASCLCEWLKLHVSCPKCRSRICYNPATLPRQHVSNLHHYQALRGLLESGTIFLEEVRASRTSGLGSIYVEGYQAFRRWAYTPTKNLDGNIETIVARIHARAHIARWLSSTGLAKV